MGEETISKVRVPNQSGIDAEYWDGEKPVNGDIECHINPVLIEACSREVSGPDFEDHNCFHQDAAEGNPTEELAEDMEAPKGFPENVWNWFKLSHGFSKGHGGVETTLRKLFEIQEVRSKALSGKLPRDLKSKLAELIKSCPGCQKQGVLKPRTRAEHFTCSTYEPMERISIDCKKIIKK